VIDLFEFFRKSESSLTESVKNADEKSVFFCGEIGRDKTLIKELLGNCGDVVYRDLKISDRSCLLLFCDGMCGNTFVNECVIKPLKDAPFKLFFKNGFVDFIIKETYSGADVKTAETMNEAVNLLFSGFCILIADGEKNAVGFGAQGFEKRSVDQPFTEVQERGSMESFVENITDNIALLRRRIKTPELKTEEIKIGSSGNTRTVICYVRGRTEKKYVDAVRKRLEKAELDCVLTSDFIKSFLDTDYLSFFSAVGSTERPDTLASKLLEGRVAVLVDGSPFAVFVPYLFSEHFQSLDDYSFRPYYALFIRCLRIICLIISIILPGLYVAVCVFHQEVLSQALLVEIAVQENITPFSITVEALVVHFMYEIVREAGLRMPKAVGHAVSIVGALVIGDAAVTAGIIAAPMVIIVALTAIGSFVVSSTYESVSVLRLIMIVTGGVSGFFGIMLGVGVIIINICAMNPYGVPHLAGVSPFEAGTLRDTVLRFDWKTLGKRALKIGNLEK
jgi:spore germination protein KA